MQKAQLSGDGDDDASVIKRHYIYIYDIDLKPGLGLPIARVGAELDMTCGKV